MIFAIVLAAGTSSRMGRPKQTLLVKGKPMLQNVLDALRKTTVDRTVVVLGANAKTVMKRVDLSKEKVLINPNYKDGMSGSLRLGLEAVRRDADAVIIVLGDKPFLSSATIDSLIRSYLRTRAPVIVPVYHGIQGNPVIFDRAMFDEVMLIRGDSGAKSVLAKNRKISLEVPVRDRGVIVDIDTPQDYEKTRSRSSVRHRAKPKG